MSVALVIVLGYKIFEWSGLTYEAAPIESTASSDVLPDDSFDTFAEREPGDWREELIALGIIATGTPETATSSDPVAYIGDILAEEILNGYGALKETDTYSVDAARSIGTSIGANIMPLPTSAHISAEELASDTDTSLARVLVYRADMRDATAPLIHDDPPEFVLFAEYVDSRNPEKLRALERAAVRYRTASENLRTVVVPEDALTLHVRAVNSLEDYANTLDRLVLFSAQPLSALALLRTYNEAERELLFAFDVLAQYYVRKSAQ